MPTIDLAEHYSCLRLILGDQLNAAHSWYTEKKPSTLYVIAELHQEASYVTHHVQKVSSFFAAMQAFAEALQQAGHQVLHLTLDDTAGVDDLPTLLKQLIEKYRISKFEYQLPDEYRLRQQLADFSSSIHIATQTYQSEHFFLDELELPRYFKSGQRHRMEAFYRNMRKRFKMLMNEDTPQGGQWNFDAENRQKLKPENFHNVPEPLVFANDVSAILERLQRHNIKTIGNADLHSFWPITRRQARSLLAYFCQYALPQFGRFQDAMTHKIDNRDLLEQSPVKKQWSLFHSRLSFALNSKILTPHEVVEAALTAYQTSDNQISIAQIEGFIRQILGWREFVRGIYWANMPTYASLNHLSAANKLPRWFWDANTNMNCMKHAIQQSLDYAYAHHIQRLMVTGNFCLLAGIHPDEVDAWYLGIYIDAIEWVELPNTRGMSQFADGGIVGSKAYAASGNYINKMSDYCGQCDYKVSETTSKQACPLNALYWRFMEHNKAALGDNPRNTMVYKNWLKQPEEKRAAILQRAEEHIKNIDTL